MCGSTSAQNTIQQEQIDFYQQMQQLTEEQYQNQQEIYGPMKSQFQSIFALGPSQEGFSAAEKATLNAQAEEGTSENFTNASKVASEEMAAEGGGNAYMPSGGSDLVKTEVAESAATEESKEQTQIELADYNQGYQEWLNAGEGLMSIASGQNPLGYANATTSSGSAASTTADQIAQEQNSWVNAVIGAAGTAAGAIKV